MIEKTYYLKDNEKLDKKIETIMNNYICWIETEIVKMNYVKIVIKCRKEDANTIDRMMKD